MRSLCRKEHDLTKGEEEFEDETNHNRRHINLLRRRRHLGRPDKGLEKSQPSIRGQPKFDRAKKERTIRTKIREVGGKETLLMSNTLISHDEHRE